jgi:hypothetical protein
MVLAGKNNNLKNVTTILQQKVNQIQQENLKVEKN